MVIRDRWSLGHILCPSCSRFLDTGAHDFTRVLLGKTPFLSDEKQQQSTLMVRTKIHERDGRERGEMIMWSMEAMAGHGGYLISKTVSLAFTS